MYLEVELAAINTSNLSTCVLLAESNDRAINHSTYDLLAESYDRSSNLSTCDFFAESYDGSRTASRVVLAS